MGFSLIKTFCCEEILMDSRTVCAQEPYREALPICSRTNHAVVAKARHAVNNCLLDDAYCHVPLIFHLRVILPCHPLSFAFSVGLLLQCQCCLL